MTALLAASLGAGPALSSPASTSTPPGSTEAASLPEVAMICRSDQVDINYASVPALKTALGVDTPTAKRVVDYRPYLAPSDLLVVQGIGPGRLAAIVRTDDTCATPTQIPPPSTEACTTSSRVDLGSATAAEIASGLKISRTSSEKIVAARPFATLRHVTPERVPGVGKGTLDSVIAASCLTPAPIRTATQSFRWAYQSQSTTVTRGLFALRVPAGVLDVSGAWISVTDIAESPVALDGPTADFHVWAPWADGVQTVDVTLPIAPDAAATATAGFTPTIAHLVPGDVEIAIGPAVQIAGGAVTTQLTSLSTVVSTLLNIALFPTPAGRYLMGRFVEEEIRNFLRLTAQQPSCTPTATDRVYTSGSAIAFDSGLERKPMLHCIRRASADGDAMWVVANNSGTVVSIYTGLGQTHVADAGHTGDALTDGIFDQWNATSSHNEDTISRVSVDIPPRGQAVIRVPAGIAEESIPIGTNESLAFIAFLLRNFSKLVPAENIPEVVSGLYNCTFNPAVTNAADQIDGLKCFIDAATIAGSGVGKAIGGAFLFVADVALSAESTIRSESGSPWQLVVTHLTFPAPPAQGQPPSGRIDDGGSPSPAGRMIIKLANSVESFVLDQSGVAHPILDGVTYICNAEVLPVLYNLDPARFDNYATGGVGSDAGCPSADPTTIAPGPQYGISPAILREADGTAWFIDQYDLRTPITEGSSFNCFAQSYFVWDYVSRAEVLNFNPAPGGVARFCIP